MHRLHDLYHWPGRHPHLVDAGIAVVLWVVFGLTVALSRMVDGGVVQALLFVVVSAQTLTLALRRRRPVLTFTVVSLACLAQLLLVQVPLPSDAGFLVALFALAAYAGDARLRRAGLGVAVLAGVLAAGSWAPSGPRAWLPMVLSGALLVTLGLVTWVYGDLVRNRRAVLARLEEQNAALRRERDQRAELAAQQERTRIAREMHDVVAHSLSVIVVQADGGAYAAEHAATWSRGDGARTLQTIAATAREALSETRHLVGVLREPGSGAADLTPTASLGDLGGLVARVRESGNEVHLTTSGDLGDLPREVELAAYRVVQESLTNVLKHAGPRATAWVEVERGSGLRVEVRDDGRGAAADSGGDGNGLIGMRERAVAVGGHLRHGPIPGGGWGVRADLPIGGPA